MNGNSLNNNLSNLPESKSVFSIQELLLKYLGYLPLFILTIGICVSAGIIYVRYTIPMYRATASMLVKSGDDKNVVAIGNNDDLLQNAMFGMGAKTVNLDNEMELIHSRSAILRVVANHGFNLYYYNVGNIKKSEIYQSGPFELVPIIVNDSNKTYNVHILNINNSGGEIENNIRQSQSPVVFKWNKRIDIDGFSFILKPRYKINNTIESPYIVTWRPISITAEEIYYNLFLNAVGKTTIIQFSIKVENPKRGEDILDAIIEEYKKSNVEDKNIIAKNTINFIEERLKIVSSELSEVEIRLQRFKDQNQIYNDQVQPSIYQSEVTELNKNLNEAEINLSIANLLNEYITKSENTSKLVPSNLGIDDNTLKFMILSYNELQLKKVKEQQLNTTNGPVSKNYDDQIHNLRNNIIESINNFRKTTILRIKEINSKKGQYLSILNTFPEKERLLMQIKREKDIKQGLFLYLLQKKEETAISVSSTVSNYNQIDKAIASPYPIEPRVSSIRTFSLILGFLIPILIIYLIDLFNDKVTTRGDIVSKLKLPIVGEISHSDAKQNIVVTENRSMVAEQFRLLRSNLDFFVSNSKGRNYKIIMVTSTMSGEGKSFISLNMAAVLSLSNKKVALLEFDLRKLSSIKELENTNYSKGITNYLIGQVKDPTTLFTEIEKLPNLHIFGCGPIPPNPSELMLNERVETLMHWLQDNYDYIILDTAPIGLVSDSFALEKYADVVFYIIRQRQTSKKQLEFIQEICNQEKLKNIALVVNDVVMGGRYGYYGYSYGYGYGYLNKYGLSKKYGGNLYSGYLSKQSESYFNETKSIFPWKKKT